MRHFLLKKTKKNTHYEFEKKGIYFVCYINNTLTFVLPQGF